MSAAASKPLGWGIVGTGTVAANFARAVREMPGTTVAGIASSRIERAKAFADRHDAGAAFDRVEDLAARDDVDVLYIASATHLHREHCLAALAAGMPVLCEKPFTASAEDAAEVAAAARAAGLFCMEAMWTRFNDPVRALKRRIDEGALGEVSGAVFSLGFARAGEADGANPDRSNIRNFGCYALSLALHLFGPVRDWKATGRRNEAGIDTDLSLILRHERVTSLIDVSSRATRTNRLDVFGSRASATIPSSLIDPGLLAVRGSDDGGAKALLRQMVLPLRERLPPARRARRSGIGGEIEEVRRCLAEGRAESAVMLLDDTLAVQRLMDSIALSF